MKYYTVTFKGNTTETTTRIMSVVSLAYLLDNWAYTVLKAVPIGEEGE